MKSDGVRGGSSQKNESVGEGESENSLQSGRRWCIKRVLIFVQEHVLS